MGPFTAFAVFTLIMVAEHPPQSSVVCEVVGTGDHVLPTIRSNPENPESETAASGGSRINQSAAVTPSAKLMIPRLRDRLSHRDGPPLLAGARVANSSDVTLRAGLVPRCAVLRI